VLGKLPDAEGRNGHYCSNFLVALLMVEALAPWMEEM
jgi:hypothetical protein